MDPNVLYLFTKPTEYDVAKSITCTTPFVSKTKKGLDTFYKGLLFPVLYVCSFIMILNKDAINDKYHIKNKDRSFYV